VNQDNDPGRTGRFAPNYTTLSVGPGGSLKPNRGAAFSLDLGSNPTQAYLPCHTSKIFFGCDFFGGLIRSFRIREDGKIVQVDAQPLPTEEFADTGAPPLPLGLWSSPKARILYVGFVTINRIGVYKYDDQGRFRFLRSVPNSGKALCWLRTNEAGTRLYTSNTADPSISVYDTSFDPSKPVEIQRLVLKGQSNVYQITLDPSGRWFYAVSQRNSEGLPTTANALHVLRVAHDGTLTEVESSPTPLNVPANSRPQGVLAF